MRERVFNEVLAAQVIADLKALGLIDDCRFAKTFAESRIRYKPSGLARIRSELYSKGIAWDIINSVLSRIERGYDEYAVAYEIARDKARRFHNISPIKAKHRIYGSLLRRRFKKDVIYEALNRIFENSE